MNAQQAVEFYNAHRDVIHEASRNRNPLAWELVRCYYEYKIDPNDVAGELLVNATLAWQENSVLCPVCGNPLHSFQQDALTERLPARTYVECHTHGCAAYMDTLSLQQLQERHG